MKTWEEQGFAAFPVDTNMDSPLHAETGMSLRDWFAGQALVGLIACYAPSNAAFDPKTDAKTAYKYADEMLAVREAEDAEPTEVQQGLIPIPDGYAEQ